MVAHCPRVEPEDCLAKGLRESLHKWRPRATVTLHERYSYRLVNVMESVQYGLVMAVKKGSRTDPEEPWRW